MITYNELREALDNLFYEAVKIPAGSSKSVRDAQVKKELERSHPKKTNEETLHESSIITSNGDHHQVYADLYRQAQTLHNISLSGYMRNSISKENHKKVKGHVKLAHGRLESANPTLGSRESIEHLNAAARHLQDGTSHFHSTSNQGLVATQTNHPYGG